jgi:hypothetical protein
MRTSTIALALLSPAAVFCAVIVERQVLPTPTPVLPAVPDPQAVRFNFVGCNSDQQKAINDAWSHLTTIGKAVNLTSTGSLK